jgi:hypothetical protein
LILGQVRARRWGLVDSVPHRRFRALGFSDFMRFPQAPANATLLHLESFDRRRFLGCELPERSAGSVASSQRGPSDYDIRNTFSGAVSYDIPGRGSGVLKQVFGNWSTDSIIYEPGPVRPGRTILTDTPRSRPVIGAFSSGFARVL